MLVAGNDDCLVCVDTSTAYPGGNSEVETLSSTECNSEGKGPKQKSVTTEEKSSEQLSSDATYVLDTKNTDQSRAVWASKTVKGCISRAVRGRSRAWNVCCYLLRRTCHV